LRIIAQMFHANLNSRLRSYFEHVKLTTVKFQSCYSHRFGAGRSTDGASAGRAGRPDCRGCGSGDRRDDTWPICVRSLGRSGGPGTCRGAGRRAPAAGSAGSRCPARRVDRGSPGSSRRLRRRLRSLLAANNIMDLSRRRGKFRRLSEVCASAGSIEKDQAEAGQAIVQILMPSGTPKSTSSVYSFLMASRVAGCAL
jgi:hypothetical protein